MQALFKVGEKYGRNATIIEDIWEEHADYATEIAVTSLGTRMQIRHEPRDAEYRHIEHAPRHPWPIIPYTRLDQRVRDGAPHGSEWIDVSGSDFDYWSVLCDLWTPAYDLTIIEHDVEARPEVFGSFANCPEPWCVFPYDNHDPDDAEAWANMLGCTRFRKELIAATPTAVSGIEERWRDWHYTCDGIGTALRAAGFMHHWHGPPVKHHSER